MSQDSVICWEEQLIIPTYPIGAPDRNPMFLEKRVYQGSSGVVYPYPVVDRVGDEPFEKTYTALFLENRYVKIMVLPEIGGRLQMALDKTNDYHFVYFNHVIKPALVGLTGPWISGGIEFNWPQHHRPTTFSPVDWRLVENPDGSKTIWCAEIERMFRTKGMHGFTLHPDKACVEVEVQLYNQTEVPQTFLWWANPAVAVNDEYQSIFPPDVHAVMDHGKRDVSTFPIATGTYYKVDYAPGTDISRYKNIPVPTSYMAYHSDFDFVGCYDHGRQAGMMHVANHHVVPGKKQWTWGNGEFGRRWDDHLTDEDGPYIELMCGAYTDNQPDFSWLQPGEEKHFSQIFMPYKDIGGAKNANEEAVINLEVTAGQALVGVYVTRPRQVKIRLIAGGTTVFRETADLSPEQALVTTVPLDETIAPQAVTLIVEDDALEIIRFTPLPDETPVIPAPAKPARPPEEIESSEELFLNGLHLEQYRHATYAPEPYYEEALRRDPGDSRCNNALGLLLYRRGMFAEAEPYFRRAIERLTLRNPNPYEGEPFYNLGLSLRMQGRYAEATGAFYKAGWNAPWQAPASFELARLAARSGDMPEALKLVDAALSVNGRLHQAPHLKAALLRRMGRPEAALAAVEESAGRDPMAYGALWEGYLLTGDETFGQVTGYATDTMIELALDYAHAGLYEEALAVLDRARDPQPMQFYTRGWVAEQAGDRAGALAAFETAAGLAPDYCFPNRLEDVLSLTTAMRLRPQDARAPYYLGNFYYGHRRHQAAIALWERARKLDPQFATVHRNLCLGYYNTLNAPQRALESIEKAFALNQRDARVFYERDQLYKKLNCLPQERLADLDAHEELVQQRDDLTIETITLLNTLGRPAEALERLLGRRFHPWEGGEGKVIRQYVVSLASLAIECLDRADFRTAIHYLERAQVYPHSLGEGKLYGAQENDIFYYLGVAYQGLGDEHEARAWFSKAAIGLSQPASAMFYNDQPPDMIFYQGLAREQLGREAEAKAVFEKLIAYGRSHMDDHVRIDYFAISLPDFLVFEDDLDQRNRIHCHYMMALGYMGSGDLTATRDHYEAILALDANHQQAVLRLAALENEAGA